MGINESEIRALIKDLGNEDFGKKFTAQDTLKEIGAPALPLLIEALQDIDLRVGAGSVLVNIGQPAVAPLLNALEDPEWRVRFVAAHSLGRIGTEEAVEPLIRALADPQPDVRKYAAEALGAIGDTRAIQPLRDRLQYEDSMLARSGIEEALKKL
jgi:HEAT repeat protein